MGIKILLADDSVTAQNMGKKILSEAGHEVVTVSNGAAAARKIAELKPELVLLDVFMPGYSGLELCEKLRNAAETAKLPVLLTVGRMEPYSPQEGARVRADGVIIKPFEASDLTAAVDRLAQKVKPGKPKPPEREGVAKSASPAQSKDELGWKQEAPAFGEENSRTSESKTQQPKDYEQTLQLDSSQIAAMLKVAEAERLSQSTASKPEFSVVEPAHSSEEFPVTARTDSESSADANLPAFAEGLMGAASSEIPSYMAQYFPSDSDSNSASGVSEPFPMAPPVSVEQSASVNPSFAPLTPESPSIDDFAATTVLPKDSVFQRFDGQEAPELPVASAEGLELTAAAPVSDVPLAHEAGFEPTLQTADTPTLIVKDPALVTDPHRATMDFVTQFGTGDAGLTEELIPSMDSPAGDKTSSEEEFEARLNAAMSAFAEPSTELPAFASGDATSVNPGLGESPSIETLHAALLSQTDGQESSLESQFGNVEAPMALEASPSFEQSNVHLVKPNAISGTEVEAGTSEAEFTPVSQEPAISEPAYDESNSVSAVSSTVISSAEPKVAPISMETVSAPETDETVIQQMREALSALPVSHSHSNEQLEADPAPMAMAAAAAVSAPMTVAGPTSIGQEAELEIARALSAAVGAEPSSVHEGITEVSEISRSGDANNVAAAVEKVMQRELPKLVWKIMAELDLRKRS